MNRSCEIIDSRGSTVYTSNPNDFGNFEYFTEGETQSPACPTEEMFNDNGIHKAEIN